MGGGFPVASLVVFVLGAVVLVETARRPQPWAPGLKRRGSDLRPRDRAERRVVRRAKWCGVLPAQRRLQRVAALWVVRPMSNSVLLGVFMLCGAVQLGMAGRGVFGPGWEGALPGMVWTLGAAALLVVVAWLRAQARKLNRAFETTHALAGEREPARNRERQEQVE